MKQFFDQWKSRTSFITNVLIIIGVVVLFYNVWKSVPFWGLFSMIVILSVPTVAAFTSCLRVIDDGYLEGKRRRLEIQREQQQLLPLSSLPTTKIAQQEPETR